MDINKNLMKFIDNTPNAYYCVNNLKEELLSNGFVELYENEIWNKLDNNGKYFVVRGDASLIAFKMAEVRANIGFNVVAVHSDSPSFSIKPNASIFENNYMKLNINGYGGMINYSWLDRPLSLAGRIVTVKNNVYEKQFVNIPKDLLVIPSQAIHINRGVNEGNKLNHQIDMLPVVSLNSNKTLEDIIMEELIKKEKI